MSKAILHRNGTEIRVKYWDGTSEESSPFTVDDIAPKCEIF